jgi:hypothetical protein
MPRPALPVIALVVVWAWTNASASQPALSDLLASATKYVSAYEAAFSLLVSEEEYIQEIRRPLGTGANLSQRNPGGGIDAAGGRDKRQVLKSDYMLVQLGTAAGWMPFRDTFEVNGKKLRDREDRLVSLFLSADTSRFDQGARIMAESTRYNIGNVARTVNIPTLGLMFLHSSVRERFTFALAGEEAVGGRATQRLTYREASRPTLIKTTRGADLPLEGSLWIDAATGAIVKTTMTAADPAVRATIAVTFRADESLEIWVPSLMEEYYKAAGSADEIVATATYTKMRRFQVSTDERIAKPPGSR